MKCIIAGSRNFTNYEFLKSAIARSGFADQITEVVSGTATGVDSLGERYAKENRIPVRQFPANWNKHGKAAGMIRNREMLDYALPDGALIVIIVNNSPGSTGMLKIARESGLRYYAVHITEELWKTN